MAARTERHPAARRLREPPIARPKEQARSAPAVVCLYSHLCPGTNVYPVGRKIGCNLFPHTPSLTSVAFCMLLQKKAECYVNSLLTDNDLLDQAFGDLALVENENDNGSKTETGQS